MLFLSSLEATLLHGGKTTCLLSMTVSYVEQITVVVTPAPVTAFSCGQSYGT